MNVYPKTMTAAIVQHTPVFLNLDASVNKAAKLIAESAGNGAGLIVFPETWLPGYPVWIDTAPEAAIWGNPVSHRLYRRLVENSITVPGEAFSTLRRSAMENGAYVVMGAHEKVGNTLYNTMLFLAPDGSYTLHRKLTPTYTEKLLWGAGDGSTLEMLDTPLGVLGGLICWEHWMPLARAAMHAKHEVFHAAQWPWVRELHQIASRQYSFEGQCFVLAAGTVLSIQDVLEGFDSIPGGDPDDRAMLESMGSSPETLLQRGGSAIIGPDAMYVTEPVYDSRETIFAELDTDRVTEGHLLMDSDGHYSRPDVFSLKVNTTPAKNVEF